MRSRSSLPRWMAAQAEPLATPKSQFATPEWSRPRRPLDAFPASVHALSMDFRTGSPRSEQLGGPGERLEHHAVALGELLEGRELVGVGVAVELEGQADRSEAHRRLAVDAQGAAEVEVALGPHRP